MKICTYIQRLLTLLSQCIVTVSSTSIQATIVNTYVLTYVYILYLNEIWLTIDVVAVVVGVVVVVIVVNVVKLN